ncbi:unnamed protein product, partial [marine sediment metagenome]
MSNDQNEPVAIFDQKKQLTPKGRNSKKPAPLIILMAVV